MPDTPTKHEPISRKGLDGKAHLESSPSFRENLRQLGTRLLPHDTRRTTCPPAAVTSGEGPLIIVPSLMRSGTHLLLDAMFNNFPTLWRSPLFIDFDAYERSALPVERMSSITGAVVKTHFPQTPLADEYASMLTTLAGRAVIVRPCRPAAQVRQSLAKWGQIFSVDEFAEVEKRFDAFWSPFSPLIVDFSTLLDPAGVARVIRQVKEKTELEPRAPQQPIMPARTRLGVYIDKLLTRAFGFRVPRINTTIGYRLSPKRRS